VASIAFIRPEVIKWARESANISLEDVAKKMGCKKEKLIEWESGDSFPSLIQAKKMSKIYRRALAIFYLPSPPKDFQPISDFRRIKDKKFSTSLIFLIREIQEKRLWLSEYLKEEGEERIPIVGQFNVKSPHKIVADAIIDFLEIRELPEDQHLKFWIQKVEEAGIFVCQTSNYHPHLKIQVEEARGFALSDPYAPFIFINSRDLETARLFTLMHEFVHLTIAESGVSNFKNLEFRSEDQFKYSEIEVFCNRVTAEVLMPAAVMRARFKSNEENEPEVENTARYFGVSQFSIYTRLLNLRLVSKPKYDQWKRKYFKRVEDWLEKESEKPKSKGGPNYYLLKSIRNSKSFSRIVFEGFKGEILTGVEASRLLGIKLNKLNKYHPFIND